jgi:site-specific DNA-methyltransferase (adenine-specific)
VEEEGVMENKLYHGNCLTIMPTLADKSIDLILCDLPYGTTACKWDTIIPFEPLWAQYKRLIKDNGAIVLTASQPFTTALIASNLKMFKYEWIWNKGVGSNFATVKYMPFKEHENIAVFYNKHPTYNPIRISRSDYSLKCHPKGKERTMPASKATESNNIAQIPTTLKADGLRSPRSIIDIKLPTGRCGKEYPHPTQKPVALFEYLILTYTNEGDMVLDNCAGSFTTAIAAMNTNRKYICIEKDATYCEIGRKRIEEYLQKKILPLFDNCD